MVELDFWNFQRYGNYNYSIVLQLDSNEFNPLVPSVL